MAQGGFNVNGGFLEFGNDDIRISVPVLVPRERFFPGRFTPPISRHPCTQPILPESFDLYVLSFSQTPATHLPMSAP